MLSNDTAETHNEVRPHNTRRLQKAEYTTQQGCMTQTGAEYLFNADVAMLNACKAVHGCCGL